MHGRQQTTSNRNTLKRAKIQRHHCKCKYLGLLLTEFAAMHGYAPFVYRKNGEGHQHLSFLIFLLQGINRNVFFVLQYTLSHSTV